MSGDTADKPIKDASTLIVLREADGRLETFMLCRHHQSGFMGGAHVFPGGKVDPSDAEAGWRARVDTDSSSRAFMVWACGMISPPRRR